MAGQPTEIVTEYDVLFAARTGVTVLLPKLSTFDGGVEVAAQFAISPDSARDIIITAADRSALLKNMRKEHIDEAVKRGSILFYEMQGEDVVRCTPCSYQKKT